MATSPDRYHLALQLSRGMAHRGIDCALVGGLAVGVRAVPRTTKDIDFAVATTDDAAAERVVAELTTLGLVPRTILEQTDTGRLATVRFALVDDSNRTPVVDLLFASCGIETEIVDGAESIQLPDKQLMPVASLAHLLAMKTLSESKDRLQDRADLCQLLLRASPRDLRGAKAAVELIAARGFARGKDLLATLRGFLRDVGRDDLQL